jgi:aspartate/methionine/tyrosine aminotransferase
MSVRFSARLPPHAERNTLTTRVERLRATGRTIVDLTESNPTTAGFPYPADLLTPLADPAALRYAPEPLGLASARRAVADDYARRGAKVDPDRVVLTASTSEAYTWLFKLLCDPGDRVLVPRPSYPLFEHLAGLEAVTADPYDLDYHGRWDMNFERLLSADSRVRAVIVVSPNNPTGSTLSRDEFNHVAALCHERGWALIVDEVFADYALEAAAPMTDFAVDAPCLTFSLGGLSKSAGLPQMKVGWMLVGGPAEERARALSALEIVADSFLSVSTPAQLALPRLLADAGAVRAAIHERLRLNLSALRDVAAGFVSCDVPVVDGGWSAVIRVPATRSEESIVLDVLERESVLVYPGFFFDFHHEAFLVVSLLVPTETFKNALPRVLEVAAA